MNEQTSHLTDRDLLPRGAVAALFGESTDSSPSGSFRLVNPYEIGVGPQTLEELNLIRAGLKNGVRDENGGSYTEQGNAREEEERKKALANYYAHEILQQTLDALDERIALTEHDLQEMRAELARIEARQAELAPLIAAQKEVVAAAQQGFDAQQLVVGQQEKVVADQKAVVGDLAAQLPAKQEAVVVATADEQAAKVELTQAKELTAEKTELKSLTEADLQATQKTYEAISATTIKDAQGREIYKKTDENGKEILVSPAGNGLSPDEVKALEEKYGAGFMDKVAVYDKEKMADDARRALQASEADFGAQNQLGAAKTNEAQAQVKWEKADEALKYAQDELTALNEKLVTETEKLKVELEKLDEEQAKLAERAKTLANETDKLKALEDENRELEQKRVEVKAGIDAKAQELDKLKTTRDDLQQKMDDPNFVAGLENGTSKMSDIKGLSPDLLADIQARYPVSTPAPGPTPAPPKDSVLFDSPETTRVADSSSTPTQKTESGVTASSALGNEPDSLADKNIAQTAFNTAAPNTTTSDPKTPTLEDENVPAPSTAPVAALV